MTGSVSSSLYLDTSAFLKLVKPETETPALRRYLAGNAALWVSSRILRTEALRAATSWAPGRLPLARRLLGAVNLLSVDVFCDQAGLLPAAPGGRLTSLDAIHLVTALSLGADLQALVTYDRQLVTSAQHHGLPIVTPL
ncbi:MAG: type II toxin-antitoxin system VapC family toxin [Candidatus Dormibacteraeota bacterium]|nr:type II toxin-antitoxin system VapC family toxin [Candidatus Dormibacteraeota bacterium]